MKLWETPVRKLQTEVSGKFIEIKGEKFYCIDNYTAMRPFFMSLVSHSDHWLFVSSTGGIAAGRRNENSALFPYYTDDKIEQGSESTGVVNVLKIHTQGNTYLWEPFSKRGERIYAVRHKLYKNTIGNKLIFEEINEDLNLSWQYIWQFSEEYGFVKTSTLHNFSDKPVEVEVLDGFQNILPYGINADLQNARSNLGNAYKKSELESSVNLGIFTLSSMIVDRAEPSEALKATTCWSTGNDVENVLLSSLQLDKFRNGDAIETETRVNGESSSYLTVSKFQLGADSSSSWSIVADINKDHSSVYDLIDALALPDNLTNSIEEDIKKGSMQLRKLVGMADGLQASGDDLSTGRHYSNVLFNIMRGGIFDQHYTVNTADFVKYVASMNKLVSGQQSKFFQELPESISYRDLLNLAGQTGHPDIIRLSYEYLPLSFSRRHGDPSRPWNQFSIDIRNSDGSRARSYQGNWRDIFQNWEALAVSFPDFLPSMITKFVNASTIDGYNPYRITREGIDWEVIEPDDPWSYIGYWGDHQIIYLLKLLELSLQYQPETLTKLLNEDFFVFANVPYKIRDYQQIVADPQDTIDFDHELADQIDEKVEKYGGDGKFLFSEDSELLKASLIEKLLLTLLTKLSNFIPGGGIWLNTQRPEWNDANNALVGNGVSMVTLYYTRRYLTFCLSLLKNSSETYQVNSYFLKFFDNIFESFKNHENDLLGDVDDTKRRLIVDELGLIGEAYRKEVYNSPTNEKSMLETNRITELCERVRTIFDVCIDSNQRADGLYHSYNLVENKESEASIDRLYEMLEGQVAVLSSGKLNPSEALRLLDTLKASKIYREDQYSYMLYPNRKLPGFLEMNQISSDFEGKSELVQKLLEKGNLSILSKDSKGVLHFNGNFHNANDLKEALKNLEDSEFANLVAKERNLFLDQFEKLFNHKAFTGRSGTFFGYEGLGSIYWHMVSKLLLAVQENLVAAFENNTELEITSRLMDHYYEIRAGIGINKSPKLYGAFPTDPYSHTPFNKGAQQPGMTGQVKEDILNRWAELGVHVLDAEIWFKPEFINPKEFLSEDKPFRYFTIEGNYTTIPLKEGQLAFTYCQVPIIYIKSDVKNLSVYFVDGGKEEFSGNSIPGNLSDELFARTGRIQKIEVHV